MATYNDRFKICTNRQPSESIRPAPKIVITFGNRVLRQKRAELIKQIAEAVVTAAREGRRMLTEGKRYHKDWKFGADGQILEPIRTV